MWNFSDAVVLGKHSQIYADNEAAQEERAPFKMPVEERVKEKLAAMGIKVPKALAVTDEGGVIETSRSGLQEAKLLHYDKEDLISFHGLCVSKSLTKACSELEYEHPTVI